ncbi:OmpA family protein [Sungkyunkwania multivorans]|uniref:OmpA family protein n=1 Tax=Sungkyunkwania multivorans TaxID=1173618 RepID=A0ABW3D2G1_9FLAO
MIRFCSTLLLILCSFFALAQEGAYKKGEEAFGKSNFNEAVTQYLKVAQTDYNSISVYKRLADSYYYQAKLLEAADWYEKYFNAGKDSISFQSEYYFKYAQSLKARTNYAKADSLMKVLADIENEKDSRGVKIKENPSYLKEIEDFSGKYSISPTDINQESSDFGTSFGLDGIVFASSRDDGSKKHKWTGDPYLELYTASIDEDGKLSDTRKVKIKTNRRYNESTTAFTKDGTTMYFTRNNQLRGNKYETDSTGLVRLKIYKATLEDGAWKNIEELPFNDNNYSVAHPTLSSDERTLYFASDMPGTYGKSDIFKVDILSDSTYSEPVNLGKHINTEGRETFPFISNNGDLYFASDGHPGVGGLDVFVSLSDPTYTSNKVLNLGKPINSKLDDFAFIIDADHKIGYFTSNREGGQGSDDIYLLKQLEPLYVCKGSISGVVKDKSNTKLANAKVELLDLNENVIASQITGADGSFNFEVACQDAEFKLYGSKEEYHPANLITKINFNDPNNTEELILDKKTFDVGTDLAKVLNIKEIYFDLNKANIRPDAAIELNKVVAYLKEYPSVKIDVRSHTDSRGSDRYNLKLSDRRAKSTIAYIVGQGISEDRVNGRGYGETSLLNKCNNFTLCSEEEHQLNRRSEFIVVTN